MKRTSGRVSVLVLLVAAAAVEANAAESGSALAEAIADCRAITTAIGRLDCYDAIELSADGGIVNAAAAVSAGAAATEEKKFGFEFDVKDALESVTSVVTEVRKNAIGGLVLTLANGQIWQQSDGQTLFMDEGESVTITRGALSAFYLTRDGKGRRYRFARVQ